MRKMALSEDELRDRTVGELQPLSSPIWIAEYDPGWPRRFETAAQVIRSALGDRVLRLEHVGSTSVPGLPAKPIIDILLVVTNSAREEEYATALEHAGYRLRIREPEWYEHRMFRDAPEEVQLHVFSEGCPEIERMLVFRNWLRSSASDRELYGRTKRELAQRAWKYTQNYADDKTRVVEEILSRALGSP